MLNLQGVEKEFPHTFAQVQLYNQVAQPIEADGMPLAWQLEQKAEV